MIVHFLMTKFDNTPVPSFIPPKENSKPKIKKLHFTREKDMLIIKLSEEGKSCEEIAPLVNRSPRSVRERLKNFLHPGFNKNSFTPQEDQLLLLKVKELGSCWRYIQVHFFLKRTDKQLRNRWICLTKPKKSKKIDISGLMFNSLSDEELFQLLDVESYLKNS